MINLVLYLDGGDSLFPTNQNAAFVQLGHLGLLHFHEVGHQVCDVELPLGAQHVGQLPPKIGGLSHKLGEDPHCGVLVLERAPLAFLLIILFFITVTCGPVKQTYFGYLKMGSIWYLEATGVGQPGSQVALGQMRLCLTCL